jgi:hypothetical protein
MEFSKKRGFDKGMLRHAFVGVGWVIYRGETHLSPIQVTITNAHDEQGEWLTRAKPQFWISHTEMRDERNGFFISSTGQTLSASERKAIWRLVRRVVRRGAPRGAMLRALIESCVWVASRHKSVGSSLLSLCIPKSAVLKQQTNGSAMFLAGPPGGDALTFLYSSGSGDVSVSYGPHLVAGGAVFTNLGARSLG